MNNNLSYEYLLQTTRHLLTRIKEHRRIGAPEGNHFKGCGATLTMDDMKVIVTSTKSVYNLMILEALVIRAIKPIINTTDEYKSRNLVIKI